ncbi:virginiamycin B lyase family protein [Streptomyces carpinensis]|uniref:virginiamycin B lyase family protein n=1 Tax=Streptomyces carpinensis TaxID=66369 RepID=UPI003CC56334
MPQIYIEEHTVADHAAGPYALTTGPDGALCFTLVHSGRIGRFVPGEEPTSHRLDPDSEPTVITPGPDGALWFPHPWRHPQSRPSCWVRVLVVAVIGVSGAVLEGRITGVD